MPQPPIPLSNVTSIIGSVVAPVGLITTTAILSSGYTGKYTAIAGQLRQMTAEYRAGGTTAARRLSLKRQLRLFHRRVSAMWGASGLLSLALFSFIATVLAVLFASQTVRLGPLAVLMLLIGLAFVAGAVGLETYEIGLARLTTAGELEDIFEETPDGA